MRVEIESDQAIVMLHDVSLPPPAGEPRGPASVLRRAAREGELFFIEAEDPVRYRIDVHLGDRPPDGPAREFQPRGGSFRLDLPSGVLSVRAYEKEAPAATLQAPPGPYVLRLFEPPEFDGARYEREMVALLGERDWRYRNTVVRLALFGCLPIMAAFGAALVARWRWYLIYAFPLALLTVAPHFLLSRTRRFREIERRMQEHERAKPHWVVTLAAAAAPLDIEGGFVANA
jgi:hypothetical protein